MPDDLWSEPREPVLLVLRAAMAAVFVTVGYQKLTDIAGAQAMFDGWGVPLADVVTPAVGVVEVVGGLAVLLGVFPRIGSIGLAFVMLGSMAYVKVPGPVLMGDGWAVDVILFASSVTILVNGPGRWTLWGLIGRRDLDPEARLLDRATK